LTFQKFHTFLTLLLKKLRLYCFSVASPHVVGVHWCVNNTWNEENLTFASFAGFFRTAPESVVKVTSDEWYEWKVTNFVSKAVEEKYERITSIKVTKKA
jgi:hypothetical protein